MVSFSIYNNGDMSLTYQGVTIDPGNTYMVSTEPERFAADGDLIADLYNSWVNIIVGHQTFTGLDGVLVLVDILGAVARLEYQATMNELSDTYIQGLQGNRFGELAIQYRNNFRNIKGNTTVVVKNGPGRLHGLMINNNNTSGIITIYDNTAGSGTLIGTLAVGASAALSGAVVSPILIGPLGLEFSTGLTIVTSGSTNNDITALYY